jgi:hypothetical protein
MILVTLPFFQYWKLMLMEVQSLGFMFLLWSRKRPLEHFFGVGDTLVVPMLSMLTSLTSGAFPDLEQPIQVAPMVDKVLALLCCIVTTVALYFYRSDSTRSTGNKKA